MSTATPGDTVRVHYTGKLEDGRIFDSSVDREPLQFTLGKNEVIPGFERAVVGMAPGQSKIARIPDCDAYGPHREEMVAVVDRGKLPEDIEPHVGDKLQVQRTDGEVVSARITEVESSTVTLDANHALAGSDLTIEVQLVEIV